MVLAALRAHLLERLLRDILAGNGFLLADLRGEILPEALEDGNPFLLAVGNIVELILHFRGELVIDPMREVLGQELVHDASHVGRREPLLVEYDIFAVLQCRDDRRVGRGPPDAVLLKGLYEACFRITRGRLGEVLFAVELLDLHRVALVEGGQASILFLRRIVQVLVIDRVEAREDHGLAGRAKQVSRTAHGEVDRNRVELGGRHLRGDRALPDHLVELALLVVEVGRDGFGRSRDRSGPDGLVRLLCVLRRALVDDRRLGQVVAAVIFRDVAAHFGHRFL